MSAMRNLIHELKLPFVVLGVMFVVWTTGQRAAHTAPDYSVGPDRAALRRVAELPERDLRESPREAPVVTLDAEH